MQGSGAEDRNVSQISVDPGPGGLVAVYLVETSDEEQTRSLRKLFEELKPHINVAQLSRGRLMSYAVQAADASLLDELENVLKSNYAFVVMQRSFDPVIYCVVKELCADTGSRLLTIPHCNICGRPNPFPDTVITLTDEIGERVMSRSYCGTCTASLVARTNKDFVLSLLSADRRDFGKIERSALVRSRARSNYLRYKVRSEA
ncbi:MAG: hypothetical protein ABFD64_02275 [Armatimonadota bacterium]